MVSSNSLPDSGYLFQWIQKRLGETCNPISSAFDAVGGTLLNFSSIHIAAILALFPVTGACLLKHHLPIRQFTRNLVLLLVQLVFRGQYTDQRGQRLYPPAGRRSRR